jgi:UDP-glucose 4-epimerase
MHPQLRRRSEAACSQGAPSILVCGGAGYIGSHTCVVLAERGYRVVIADNLSNASARVITRLEQLTRRPIDFRCLDIRDRAALSKLFSSEPFDAVIHFAALKAVGESCEKPLEYFDNNVGGTIALLQEMREAGVSRLVFSSSATVYGTPERLPVDEDARLDVTNPYGRTKLMVEQMLGDLCLAEPAFKVANLRYFNPVGAHPSGLMGEDPSTVPNNLMPYVSQVASGRLKRLRIFGGDYPTSDGTGVRDYIHVMDLARAHVDAIEYLQRTDQSITVNLGRGRGVSVLELVASFRRATGREIPFEIVARRPGDVAEVYADPSRANHLLGWRAEFDIDAMCSDAWRWQSLNPNGYRGQFLDRRDGERQNAWTGRERRRAPLQQYAGTLA